MSLFLLSFLLIYGGFNLYFFLKAKAAFTLPRWIFFLLAVFLLVMIAAPILVRISERSGYDQLAMFLAYFGYTWMGIVFLFTAASFAVDICRIIIWILSLLHKKLLLQIKPKPAFYIPLVFSLVISVIGAFEAWDIKTEKVTLTHEKIPASLSGLRIVQISDVHLGLIVRHKRLRKILEAVREANPDILVSTGDLVDGQINKLEGLAEMLQSIKPRYGKYAVTGNHEFYAGLKGSLAFMEEAGFKVLRGTAVQAGPLRIAGVDDPAGTRTGELSYTAEGAALDMGANGIFTILMKHQPNIREESLGRFDLQLSGHTHNGQIFPFNLLVKQQFNRISGMYQQGNSRLYVSSGTGTWGPLMRLGSMNEISVFDIEPELSD